jgi:predicted AlkP superfamily phosphohydrolase/phosphomutase
MPWLQQNELPTLRRLFDKGASGTLETVLPINSVAAWTSFATGTQPDKHGVGDFACWENGSWRLLNSTDNKQRCLWDYLGSSGLRSGVVNLPFTFPPQYINGFMVTGFLTPSTNNSFTYPPEYQNIVTGLGYQIDLNIKPELEELGVDHVLSHSKDISRARTDAALALFRRTPVDFLTLVYTCSDRLQHWLWGNNAALLDYYRFLDGELTRVLEGWNSDQMNILIVSDHGFDPSPNRYFHIFSWLQQRGFLPNEMNYWTRFRVWLYSHMKRMLGAKTGLPILGTIARYGSAMISPKASDAIKQEGPWKLTGYCLFTDPEFSQSQLKEIVKGLREVKDPDNGQNVFEGVWLREELYEGKETGRLPQLIFQLSPGYRLNDRPSKQLISVSELQAGTGHHDRSRDGIIIAHGPDIMPGEVKDAMIIDVAPTVLNLFGLVAPPDMDGKPLDILKPEIRASAMRAIDSDGGQAESSGTYEWSDDDEEKVAERLRGLGYLE